MTKQEFLHAFEEILELDRGTLSGSEQLYSLKSWDSLAVLGFLAFADEKFGIALAPTDINRTKTVNELIALLGSSITSS